MFMATTSGIYMYLLRFAQLIQVKQAVNVSVAGSTRSIPFAAPVLQHQRSHPPRSTMLRPEPSPHLDGLK